MSNIDPLEELMRSRLLDEKPADNRWNVPPDSVFEDAMNAIDADKKDRKKPFFIILLAAVILTVIGLLTYRMNQRITHLNSEFNELKNQSFDNNVKSEDKLIINSSKVIPLDKKQDSSEQVKTSSAKSTNYAINSRKINYSLVNRSNSPLLSNSQFLSSNILPANQSEKIIPNSIASSNFRNEKNSASLINNPVNGQSKQLTINLLATKQLSLISNSPLIILQEELKSLLHPIKKHEKENELSPFSLFSFAGANISSIHMKNMSESSFSLSGYEKYRIGYQLGIGLEYLLNDKWALNSSLSYTAAKNRSEYKADYKYDQSNEFTNSLGEIIYLDKMVIESPMHHMTETVTFKTSNSGPVHDDMMETKVAFEETLHFASLDIGLDYTFYETDRIKLNTGLGIRGQYLLKMNEDMDMQLYHDNHMMMEKSTSHNSMDQMNRALIAPFGRIGIDYNINDRNTIRMTGNYYHPLRSIRHADIELDPTTYLKSIEFSVLFKHRLN